MDKIEILEAIRSEPPKIADYVICLSSHFCPIQVDKKKRTQQMLSPSFFSYFISYNANQIRESVISAQFSLFSLLIFRFQTKCKCLKPMLLCESPSRIVFQSHLASSFQSCIGFKTKNMPLPLSTMNMRLLHTILVILSLKKTYQIIYAISDIMVGLTIFFSTISLYILGVVVISQV